MKRYILVEATNKIIVRPSKKSDCTEIINMIKSFDEKDKKFLAFDKKISFIRSSIRSEKHCLVACDGDKIVGFLMESGRPNSFSMLEELEVDPNYRKKGIATLLMNEYHKKFSKTLAKTNAKNIPIINLLKKNGYKAENPDSPRIINWVREVK